jgi:hypothetical protein
MDNQPSNRGDGAPLTDKLLEAIANHLNQDHSNDLLACAKSSHLEWAEEARVAYLDAAGITLEVYGKGNRQSLRLDFSIPVKEVLAFKQSLGTLIAEKRALLTEHV